MDEDSFCLVLEYLGEPNSGDAPALIRQRLGAIMALSWVSRRFVALYSWWFDNAMDITFHP